MASLTLLSESLSWLTIGDINLLCIYADFECLIARLNPFVAEPVALA